MMKLSFSNTRTIEITDCEWKDLQISIRYHNAEAYGCFDGAEVSERGAEKEKQQ